MSKDQPPVAKFVLRVSSSAPGRRPYISPGKLTLAISYID